MTMRNWQDATPQVHHDTAIVWFLFRAQGTEGCTEAESPLQAMNGLTRHMVQAGKASEYHDHDDKEQLYYIISGHGKVKIDGKIHPIKAGDAVYLAPKVKHQIINDSDDWIEHILVDAKVPSD